jgi:hypothetical protein
MVSKAAQCILGFFKARQAEYGYVDDKVINDTVSNPQSKAKYANEYMKVSEKKGQGFFRPEHLQKLEEWGLNFKNDWLYFRSPNAVLGDELTNAVESVYQQHIAAHGTNAKKAWDLESKAVINQMRETLMPKYKEAGLEDFATRYFDHYANGGKLYNRTGFSNPISNRARNVVGNLVTWNPGIAALNFLEVGPKSLAYAIEYGNGPQDVFRALTQLAQETGNNPFKKIARFEKMGLYGVEEATSKLSKLNPVDASETMLRNISALMGEISGRGATDGLEKIGFIAKYGNDIQAAWTLEGADTISLMRFTIAASKMYIDLARRAVKDPKAAMALAAFTAMNAVQTGGVSAVPAPFAMVWKGVDPDSYEALQELDEEVPVLNLSKHLGMDFSDKVQPLGGAALGVGFSILTSDLSSGVKNIGKVPGDLADGEVGLATARFLEGLMGVGQVAKIPGVNLTTQRFIRSVVDTMEKDGDLAEFSEITAENMGLR